MSHRTPTKSRRSRNWFGGNRVLFQDWWGTVEPCKGETHLYLSSDPTDFLHLPQPGPNIWLGTIADRGTVARIQRLLELPAQAGWLRPPLLFVLLPEPTDIRPFLHPTLVTSSGERLQHPDPTIPSRGGSWEWGLGWVILAGTEGQVDADCREAGVPVWTRQRPQYPKVHHAR